MYPVFLEPTAVCGDLGICKVKSVVAEPTCEDCLGGTEAVAGLMSSEETLIAVMEFLKVTILISALL